MPRWNRHATPLATDLGVELGWIFDIPRRERSVPDLGSHPVSTMLAAGVEICLSIDDPGMFDTYLNREYELVSELAGLDGAAVSDLAGRSFTASFAPPRVRDKAVAEIDTLTARGNGRDTTIAKRSNG